MFFNPRISFHTTDEKNNVVFNGVNGAFDIFNSELCHILINSDEESFIKLDENTKKH